MVIREYDEVIDKVTGKWAIVVYIYGPGSYMVEPLDYSYEPNWRDESQLKKVRHKNPQNHYDEKENNEWYGTD